MIALGMIEVVGLTLAIVAADTSLKAANIKLLAIVKADAGILTVLFTGDVDAVNAAADAAEKAVKLLGDVRAKDVIPRLDDALKARLSFTYHRVFQKQSSYSTEPMNPPQNTKDLLNPRQNTKDPLNPRQNTQDPLNPQYSKSIDKTNGMQTGKEALDNKMSSKDKETNANKTLILIPNQMVPVPEQRTSYTAAELKKKSNLYLKELLEQQGVLLDSKGTPMKKQDYIQMILMNQKKAE